MMCRLIGFVALVSLYSLVHGQDIDLASVMTDSQKAAAEKQSLQVNDAMKDVKEDTGINIPLPEDSEGLMRLFFTATPSPSTSPTPSVTPSASVTPTPSSSAAPSAASSKSPTTPLDTPASTPSKSPSPTPFADGSSKIINGQQVIRVEEVVRRITSFATADTDSASIIEIPINSNQVAIGDPVEITSIQAAGDFTQALATEGRFATEMDFGLPGVARTATDAEFCGLKLYFDTVALDIVPDSCDLKEYQVGTSLGEVAYNTEEDQRVARIQVVATYCKPEEDRDCSADLIVKIAVYKPVDRSGVVDIDPEVSAEPLSFL